MASSDDRQSSPTGSSHTLPLAHPASPPPPEPLTPCTKPSWTPSSRKKLPTGSIADMEEEGIRRNPKRKANEPNKEVAGEPLDLLQEALKPLDPKEIEEWEGWAELESEPAFFNTILRDLGVMDVRAQELFTLDQDSIAFLPNPIFGLIFLFQYSSEEDMTEDADDTDEVWFANQLKEFKESTKELGTALRGYQLSNNTFIRSIHNSFTRRLDHLHADLALENQASLSRPGKSKARSHPTKGKSSARKKMKLPDYAFHFVAYVPAGGHVWELDGLKTKPLKLGLIDGDDWTEVARPHIDAKMFQYEDSQLAFNLLALCKDPTQDHSRKIAECLTTLRLLVSSVGEACSFQVPDYWLEEACSPASLSDFQLQPSDFDTTNVPKELETKISTIASAEEAQELYDKLVIETKAAMGEYRSERMSMADDEQRVKGRKNDFGPALHKWVTKLAERGLLQDLIENN